MAKKKILFVDDEPVVVKLMKTRIESRDFEVETAASGIEALEKLKNFHPDLVLLDVIMPEMDGFETCRRIKDAKETAHLPVILFTASQDAKLQKAAQKAGADKVVQKPFVNQVFETIAEILGP